MNLESETIAPLALSIGDAAKAAGISRSGLYTLLREGNGPRVTALGARRLIRVADLDAWLTQQAGKAAA